MSLKSYTFKTELGVTSIPSANYIVEAMVSFSDYHGFVSFEVFWHHHGGKGMTIKVSRPKAGGIVHIPPKPPKPKKPRVARPPLMGGGCYGCGSFLKYTDEEGVVRCSECERTRQ